MQPYLFVFKLAKFGAFWDFLGPLGHFWSCGQASKTFLGPTYVDKQLWFCFLIWQHLEPLLHFFLAFWGYLFVPSGLFLGSGSGSKTFLGPTYVDNQLWFWKYSSIFLFLIRPNFGPLLHFFGLSGLSFWPFRAIFGVGVWFKNIFGTNICRQSSLVLEIQLYLFVFDSVKFWSFFVLFGPFGTIFGLGSGSKTFLRLAYIDNQLWFWKYSHIFLFLSQPHSGSFYVFFRPIRLFLF